MIQVLKDSLKLQTECPKCGVDWAALEDSLYEGGPDYIMAQTIIRNCPVCTIQLKRSL